MRTPVSELDLRKATSVDEALGILRDDPRTPVAGATDIYVALNFGTLAPRRFLDIWTLDELRTISVHGDTLVIGALTSYTALMQSHLVAERVPMLAEASRLVGGVQIQNRGTIGGNIANGSPAADGVPVLSATDSVIVLRSVDGERRIPVNSFYSGYRKTVMRPDELIIAVEIPAVEGKQWFRKVGTRAAQAISKIVMAAVRSPTPRIALGSVGPTVVRVPETERALASGASIDEAAEILGREIVPIDDVRSTADYRRRVAMNLLKRFWSETG
ncbi:MAG: xanthine dehydrogenase family protein subunit M [Gemmatimonadota bacterium]|nr:xanthine dehydrogenase family protein subunit M [Gemmatimonadota bacterium]